MATTQDEAAAQAPQARMKEHIEAACNLGGHSRLLQPLFRGGVIERLKNLCTTSLMVYVYAHVSALLVGDSVRLEGRSLQPAFF